MSQNTGAQRLEKMIAIAIMGAVGFILYLLDFPLPLFPPFLKVDFSEIPAILAAITFGPIAGIWVEAIKNIIHFMTGGEPIGVMANFVAGSILVSVAAVIYRKRTHIKGLVTGLIIGSLSMVVFMAIANFFVIYPLYVGWSTPIAEKLSFIIVVIPFNMVKGVLIMALMIPLYLKLKGFIESKAKSHQIRTN